MSYSRSNVGQKIMWTALKFFTKLFVFIFYIICFFFNFMVAIDEAVSVTWGTPYPHDLYFHVLLTRFFPPKAFFPIRRRFIVASLLEQHVSPNNYENKFHFITFRYDSINPIFKNKTINFYFLFYLFIIIIFF